MYKGRERGGLSRGREGERERVHRGGRAIWPIRGRGCDRRACLLIRGGWRECMWEESLTAHQGEGDDISGISKPRKKVFVKQLRKKK